MCSRGHLSRSRRISQSDNEHRRSNPPLPRILDVLYATHRARSCDDRVRWGCDIPATVIGLVSVASEGSIGSVMINCRLPPGKRPSKRRCLVGLLLSQLELAPTESTVKASLAFLHANIEATIRQGLRRLYCSTRFETNFFGLVSFRNFLDFGERSFL